MARKDDPRVTDLARYRRAREQARRTPPRKPQPSSERLLGGRRNAGVILAIVAIVLLALWLGPIFL
ncbi:hypothetical protein [Phenylobacterium sp.]|jgi:hypothetical protein|uniref:hypothetical protein n=1 Tax=Phenylobacterium sp. TaxID=1871053 RepID=UPI00378313CB